jgi:hypothetical protein
MEDDGDRLEEQEEYDLDLMAAATDAALAGDEEVKLGPLEMLEIEAYKAERGAYTMLLSKAPSKIVKAFPGYSEDVLKELGAAVAKQAGVPARPIDTTGAPKKMVSGCLFPEVKPVTKP